MTRQPTTLLLLLFSALLPIVAAQQPSAAPSSDPALACSVHNGCLDCVSAGCAWGIGTCFSSCAELPELACYSVNWYDEGSNAADEVCELQQKETADAANCGIKTSCGACTSTILSAVRQDDEDAPSTCHWYDDRQICSHVACDNQGCSSPYCPDTPEGECYFGADNCLDCLDTDSCSWSGGSCELNCLQDTACYSPLNFPELSEQAICRVAANFEADTSLCLSQTDCTSCTEALQTDGSSCAWYYDAATRTGWCGLGGCDANGNCGLESCDDFGPACAALEQFDPEDLTCQACLDADCAWTGAAGLCLEDCNFLADAPCYTVEGFASVTSVCNQAETDIIDAGLCDVATDLGCEKCTSTLKSDRRTTCRWFEDSFGGGSGYCGAGTGCDQLGNCGKDTCDGTEGDPEVCGAIRTCTQCLRESPCVWDGEECFASCDDLGFGAICYSGNEPNFALQSNFAICNQAATAGGSRDIETSEDTDSAISRSNMFAATLMVVVAAMM